MQVSKRGWVMVAGVAIAVAVGAALLWIPGRSEKAPAPSAIAAFKAGALITVCGELNGEIDSPPPGRAGTFKDVYTRGP